MRKYFFAWAIGALVIAVLAVRGYREYVPWGASPQPYLLAAKEGPTTTSPDGTNTLRVVFNDAGAAHSGSHWTWVITYSPMWGHQVVAQGYLDPLVAVRGEPVPLRWLDERTLEVEFLSGRRGGTPVKQVVGL